MTRTELLNRLGLGLVAACFVWSCVTVFFKTSDALDPKLVVIRFAHWQLEGGVRAGLDAVARDYEKVCAARGQRVKVEQLAIPETVYSNWFITQLVGGTAPDLLELSDQITDDRKARYFLPLTFALDQPNIYNRGTELEKTRWQDTFIGNLTSLYNPALLDYYQIPVTVTTVRMYYNEELYAKIVGDSPLPTTYAQLHDLCARTQDYAKTHAASLLPIAGSRDNSSSSIISVLMASQTELLSEKINLNGDLYCTKEQAGLAFLRGDWNLGSPEITSGLRLVQDVSQYMQPGFQQVAREDATFYFAQGQALMRSTGSWDATSIFSQAPFKVGVFRIPLPDAGDPTFGKYVRGQVSEAGGGVSFDFGLYRDSPHREQALDFLRFLSSKRGARTFTDVSGWLPITRNVEPNALLKGFEPVVDGYVAGFNINIADNTQRIYDNNFYRLLNGENGLHDFVNQAAPDYAEAVKEDLALIDKGRVNNIYRSDVTVAALRILNLQHPEDRDLNRKLQDLTSLQTDQELSSALVRHVLHPGDSR